MADKAGAAAARKKPRAAEAGAGAGAGGGPSSASPDCEIIELDGDDGNEEDARGGFQARPANQREGVAAAAAAETWGGGGGGGGGAGGLPLPITAQEQLAKIVAASERLWRLQPMSLPHGSGSGSGGVAVHCSSDSSSSSYYSNHPHPVRLPPLPRGKAFFELYDLILLVDHRETFSGIGGKGGPGGIAGGTMGEVLRWLGAKGVRAECRALVAGDVQWVARAKASAVGAGAGGAGSAGAGSGAAVGSGSGDAIASPQLQAGTEYCLDWILERKTGLDLEKSIHDARLYKQRSALLACGLRHVMYLIEGDLTQLSGGGKGPLTAATGLEASVAMSKSRAGSGVWGLGLGCRGVVHYN